VGVHGLSLGGYTTALLASLQEGLSCVIAAMTEPAVAKYILKCMGLPPRAPPLQPARTSGFASGPWLEEAGAADFDQSPPDDCALGA
jgi:hypothetical protein